MVDKQIALFSCVSDLIMLAEYSKQAAFLEDENFNEKSDAFVKEVNLCVFWCFPR